jgi:transcriptional regulator NrdR family protein
LALAVQQPSGAIEPFLREKLFISIYESCKHRSSALEDAEAITSTIIGNLLGTVQNATLPRSVIATTAAGVLKNFDYAAHTHYTAFHLS